MREYGHIDEYLNELADDIYNQPPDENHSQWALEFINQIPDDYSDVLDVGCGQGFTYPMFSVKGKRWTGVTLGEDYKTCKLMALNVFRLDFSFMNTFADNTFDLVFARHVLEHSVMPLLTLMEWRRLSKKYLAIVLPSPKHFKYFGRNHYSVMSNTQFLWLAARAGWKAIYKNYTEPQELRYVLVKSDPRIEFPHETEGDLIREYGEM